MTGRRICTGYARSHAQHRPKPSTARAGSSPDRNTLLAKLDAIFGTRNASARDARALDGVRRTRLRLLPASLPLPDVIGDSGARVRHEQLRYLVEIWTCHYSISVGVTSC